jgi:hypothetical protein
MPNAANPHRQGHVACSARSLCMSLHRFTILSSPDTLRAAGKEGQQRPGQEVWTLHRVVIATARNSVFASIFSPRRRTSPTVSLDCTRTAATPTLPSGQVKGSRCVAGTRLSPVFCCSAYGLIWLAGNSKFVTPGARIGLHAASSRAVERATGLGGKPGDGAPAKASQYTRTTAGSAPRRPARLAG